MNSETKNSQIETPSVTDFEAEASNILTKPHFSMGKRGNFTTKDLWDKAFEYQMLTTVSVDTKTAAGTLIKAFPAADLMNPFMTALANAHSNFTNLGIDVKVCIVGNYSTSGSVIVGLGPSKATNLTLMDLVDADRKIFTIDDMAPYEVSMGPVTMTGDSIPNNIDVGKVSNWLPSLGFICFSKFQSAMSDTLTVDFVVMTRFASHTRLALLGAPKTSSAGALDGSRLSFSKIFPSKRSLYTDGNFVYPSGSSNLVRRPNAVRVAVAHQLDCGFFSLDDGKISCTVNENEWSGSVWVTKDGFQTKTEIPCDFNCSAQKVSFDGDIKEYKTRFMVYCQIRDTDKLRALFGSDRETLTGTGCVAHISGGSAGSAINDPAMFFNLSGSNSPCLNFGFPTPSFRSDQCAASTFDGYLAYYSPSSELLVSCARFGIECNVTFLASGIGNSPVGGDALCYLWETFDVLFSPSGTQLAPSQVSDLGVDTSSLVQLPVGGQVLCAGTRMVPSVKPNLVNTLSPTWHGDVDVYDLFSRFYPGEYVYMLTVVDSRFGQFLFYLIVDGRNKVCYIRYADGYYNFVKFTTDDLLVDSSIDISSQVTIPYSPRNANLVSRMSEEMARISRRVRFRCAFDEGVESGEAQMQLAAAGVSAGLGGFFNYLSQAGIVKNQQDFMSMMADKNNAAMMERLMVQYRSQATMQAAAAKAQLELNAADYRNKATLSGLKTGSTQFQLAQNGGNGSLPDPTNIMDQPIPESENSQLGLPITEDLMSHADVPSVTQNSGSDSTPVASVPSESPDETLYLDPPGSGRVSNFPTRTPGLGSVVHPENPARYNAESAAAYKAGKPLPSTIEFVRGTNPRQHRMQRKNLNISF